MNISINTDYVIDNGNPFPFIEKIARSGFKNIQWIHHWNSDFIYMESEIEEIKNRLSEMDVSVNDIHASSGREKVWYSEKEYERRAGVELIKNRMDMAQKLGGDTIILHPTIAANEKLRNIQFQQGLKSLKELEFVFQETGIKIALENLDLPSYQTIENYFDLFNFDYLGFCWDTGHSNIVGKEAVEWAKHLAIKRLITTHLNDNTCNGYDKLLITFGGKDWGLYDEHLIPFDGKIDWESVAKTIALSPLPSEKLITFEVSIKKYNLSENDFIAKAYKKSILLAEMIGEKRSCPK